uniref:Poly [ADP-ribose] polymerase n=1 Tax=Poecilia mexicana TaxID=48701 RepID=A0A3B3WK69_9TELE
MTVVVGERSQVEGKLSDLESRYVKNKGSRPSDIQTTFRRIGEAKLRLLWKVIESSLGQDFPGLKVTQADEGKIALLGSVEEILKAGEVISEKEKLVLERTITDKSLQFLAFLKNVYGGPGMLSEFLGVAETVEAEIRDTTLHFFSFSVDKLDESVKMIQENFKDVTYDIPNYPVLPPELCEALKSRANEINKMQCRAMVGVGVGGTVCLSGHSVEVDELSEIVSQFILDQVSVEGKVILPFPELRPLLTEFLQRQRFDYSGVTFTPVASSSSPTVLLVGPSIKVTEVRNRLGPLLQSVVQNKVTIDLPGAARYFSGHSGRDMLIKVAESQKCLIQLEDQPHLSRQMTRLTKYNLQHGLQVIVYQGDITKQNADAIVNAANEDLNHIGGVAAALSKAGGPQVQKESKALVKGNGKVAVGDVVVTTGGDLKCKSLLHAVGPESGKASGRERSLLEKTVCNALNLAELMEFKSIALPCISSGIYGVPIKVCWFNLYVSDILWFLFGYILHVFKVLYNMFNTFKVRINYTFLCVTCALALDLPSHWEPMQDEIFKKVDLQPNSNEYQKVASDFLKTANYTIHKIERVQNLYLWNAYSVCRQRILAKNGQAELCEKSLYHGTSAESCNCIERDRFDRSYAGAHAAAYGKGVYFAVNAEYSAKRFSPPDQSGMKRLYVARVLTGRYTLGKSSMKAPPPRGADPTDCFDSLVDNTQQPTMFIVFHDDQAYPEHLITFS